MSVEEKVIEVGADGVSRLFEWGGIVTILVLVVIAMASLCVYLVRRNNQLADKFVEVLVDVKTSNIELKSSVDAFREALRYVTKS